MQNTIRAVRAVHFFIFQRLSSTIAVRLCVRNAVRPDEADGTSGRRFRVPSALPSALNL